ncbi:MAG: hypothetical protein KDL87_01480 [Verrucomicrobiae bacterium]|nr:hypothetical protein [Verrucomicrobiae bacterium]
MNNGVSESDWKRFRAKVPEWRERYLERKNRELAAVFTDKNRTPTDQFWEVEERVNKEAKTLRRCLDGHRRSGMVDSMASMMRCGMLTDADLVDFSEDLRATLAVLKEI